MSDYPEECPITGEPLFMTIEHPELGLVPTYGGPYDSYTIPEIDDDGDFIRYRYDHDEGLWVDGVECVGSAVDIITVLREKLAAERKKNKWIPVSERLPKFEEDVLVWTGTMSVPACIGKTPYGKAWYLITEKCYVNMASVSH